jgi:hypothetical protein
LENFDLRVYLTPDQLARANEIFFEIAQNLERMKQDTQKLQSLDVNEKAQLMEPIDFEDHLIFKTMMYVAGLGDINSCESFLGRGES